MKRLSVAHFLVDGCCGLLVAMLTAKQGTLDLLLALLLYNFCAFALELPLAVLLEERVAPLKLAAVGMVLVAVSWLAVPIPLLALILAGVGNAAFHLGGGLSVLQRPTLTPIGIFVAPGAIGIYLGTLLGQVWHLPFLLATVGMAVLLWYTSKPSTFSVPSSPKSGNSLVLVSLFLLVVLRGFSAISPSFEWKADWSLAFVLAVVLGKSVGGILADRFGVMRVGTISLLVTTLCFAFPSHPLFGLVGVFAFQVTMPITLRLLSQRMAHGLAFGLLTFGLFIGSLPMLLGFSLCIPLAVWVAVSLVLFVVSLRKER